MKSYVMSTGSNRIGSYYIVKKAAPFEKVVIHFTLLDQIDDSTAYDHYTRKFPIGILNINKNTLRIYINVFEPVS